ncbi:hypothetical protein CN074_28860 [Sinorhizobium medicae]|uniref:hypothetical protein n=1 Tax=Sinorhizobium medicae TaxID=110321 RepID=UPI000FDC11B4|nr:hypothetical protein [Sinorhizobium medicae]RVH92233.1 hypothetical protein CN201_11620 [Sinorhizobium medicae]RVP61607.1 hypothetical protein CN074_28860 [Sinorhizobium medicae]
MTTEDASTVPALAEPLEYELTNFRHGMQALVDERKRREIRLIDLEEWSGVSMNSLYAWKSGVRSPTLVHFMRACEVAWLRSHLAAHQALTSKFGLEHYLILNVYLSYCFIRSMI